MKVSLGLKNTGYLLAAWLMAILYVATGHFADPDLWGRLSMGALYFQGGRFPYHDIFSYTAPHARWVDHEWLTGLVFYQLLTRLGEPGFLAFKYGMMLGIFGLLFRLHRKVYQVSPMYTLYGLILTVGAYSVGLYATVRSHIFTFLFFALFIYLLEQVRLGRRSRNVLLVLPLIGLIWGNLHGGFIMGVLLLGCYAIGEAIRHRSLRAGWVYGALALATFLLPGVLNPYGPSYISFLFHAWTLDRSHIGEWSAMRFGLWYFLPGQLLVVAALTLPLLRGLLLKQADVRKGSLQITPSLVVVWLALMTVKGVRFQPFLAWGLVAYAPLLLSSELAKVVLPAFVIQFGRKQVSAFKNTLPLLILLVSVAGAVYLQTTINLFRVPVGDELTQDPHIPIRYPLGALNYLKQSPYQGNLSVRFGFGEFIYWHLYPQFKVSMDGRYEEVYSQDEFLRNDAFYDKEDPFRAFKAINKVKQDKTEFILLETSLPNLGGLIQSGDWKVIYSDKFYAVLGRVSVLNTYPPFVPTGPVLSDRIFTLADFITPADLRRIQQPSGSP